MSLDLLVERIKSNKETTIGTLFVNNKGFCSTIEDEYRTQKKYGETRIPAGTYEIILRNEGEMTKRYRRKFPDLHKGMLWLRNVDGFEFIYIHIGNSEKDTEGCILVNYSVNFGTMIGSYSTQAYKDLYKIIVDELGNNKVFIKIVDRDL